MPNANHDDQDNIYFVGQTQRAAVDDLVSAHNTNAEWLMWFDPGKALSVTYCVEMPPEHAQPPSMEGVHHSLWRSIAHCTQALQEQWESRARVEAYLQMCVRTPVS